MGDAASGLLSSCGVNWEGLQLKKKIMCEVPDIVFQRAHPPNPTSSRRLTLKKKKQKKTTARWAPLAPAGSGQRRGGRWSRCAPARGGEASGGKAAATAWRKGRQVRGAGRTGGWESISASPILPPPHLLSGVGTGGGREEWNQGVRSTALTTVALAG